MQAHLLHVSVSCTTHVGTLHIVQLYACCLCVISCPGSLKWLHHAILLVLLCKPEKVLLLMLCQMLVEALNAGVCMLQQTIVIRLIVLLGCYMLWLQSVPTSTLTTLPSMRSYLHKCTTSALRVHKWHAGFRLQRLRSLTQIWMSSNWSSRSSWVSCFPPLTSWCTVGISLALNRA